MADEPIAGNKFITQALKRFNTAVEAENSNREHMLDDLKFRAGEQWPTNVKQERDIAKRPCLTINRIPQYIRQVTNDARQNRPQLKIIATDDSTEEVAEILEGLCRQIQVGSDAGIAYDTACDAQVTMGRGYFRVITDYVDENSFDQEIKIKRIKNAFTVYFDPGAIEPDYSDAKWCFVVSDMQKDEFKEAYPDSQMLSQDLSSIGDNEKDWMGEDYIRVAEYFYVEEKEETLYLLSNGKTTIVKPDESLLQQMNLTIKDKRLTTTRKVCWSLITAVEELDHKDWAGKFIPIIPVLGDDFDIDGRTEIMGLVRGAKDPQRMSNYWETAMTEAVALAPKSPWVAAEGQIEGYEAIWQNSNTSPYSVLPYKPTTIAGVAVPPPQRNSVETPIQAMAQARQSAIDNIDATTGIYRDKRAQESNAISGKAIIARQKQGDISTFNFIDNLSRSIRHLGRILLDLIPKIYDAPRIVRITHADQTTEAVQINAPFQKKEMGEAVQKIYDVRTGKYDVEVDIGPSFATKRQEKADAMQSLAQAYPPLMDKAGDLMVKAMDIPDADQIAERIKPPGIDDEVPPQAKAQMQQMMQLIKQMTGELNKQYAKSAFKEMELASKERIANANNETKLVQEVMKHQTSGQLELLKAELGSVSAKEQAMNINQPIPTATDDVEGALDAAKQSLAQSQQLQNAP